MWKKSREFKSFEEAEKADREIYKSLSPSQRLEILVTLFGFASLGIVAADLPRSDHVIQLGVEPNRIDLMTSISGVSFEEAWDTRQYGKLDGVRLPLHITDFIEA